MKKFAGLLAIAAVATFSVIVFAQDATMPVADFLSQIMSYIKTFGGLPWVLKIAGLVAIIVSSMKVSFLRTLVWDKLGKFKAWAAPVLGLAVGILSLYGTKDWSLAGVLTYMGAGAGAILVHELLDTIKHLPGIGGIWVQLIEVIEASLGGGTDPGK